MCQPGSDAGLEDSDGQEAASVPTDGSPPAIPEEDLKLADASDVRTNPLENPGLRNASGAGTNVDQGDDLQSREYSLSDLEGSPDGPQRERGEGASESEPRCADTISAEIDAWETDNRDADPESSDPPLREDSRDIDDRN